VRPGCSLGQELWKVQRWHTKLPGNQEDVKKDERCGPGAAQVQSRCGRGASGEKCRGAALNCQVTKQM